MSELARVPEVLETPDPSSETVGELQVISSPEIPNPAARWWRIADCGVLAAWVAVVGFTLRYHEKWADERRPG